MNEDRPSLVEHEPLPTADRPPPGARVYPRSAADLRARIGVDLHLPMSAALGLVPGWAARLRASLAGAACPPLAVDSPGDEAVPFLRALARVTPVVVTPVGEASADTVDALADPLVDALRALEERDPASGFEALREAWQRTQARTPLQALRDGEAALAERLVPWHAPQAAWWLLLAAEHQDMGHLEDARRLFRAARDLPSIAGGREAITWLVLCLAPLDPPTAMAIGLRVFGLSYASDAVLRLAPVLRDASAIASLLHEVADADIRAEATVTAATWLAEHGWPGEAVDLIGDIEVLPRTALPLVDALVAGGRTEAAEQVADRLSEPARERALLLVATKRRATIGRLSDPRLEAQALAAHDDRPALEALARAQDIPEIEVACATVALRRGDDDAAERRAIALAALETIGEPRRRAHLLADLGTAADLLDAARIASKLDGWDARPLLDRILGALIEQHRWDDARAVDEMQERPDLRGAEMRIALALARLGRFEEARAALDKVARLQYDAGDVAGAARTLDRALAHATAQEEEVGRQAARLNVAAAMRHCGRLADAREVLNGCLAAVRALPARYVALGTQLPLELVRCGLEEEAVDMAARLSGDRVVVEVAARLRDRRRARDVVARTLSPAPARNVEESRPLSDLLALLGGQIDAAIDPDMLDLFPESADRDLERDVAALVNGEPGDLDAVLRLAAARSDRAAIVRLLPLATADERHAQAALAVIRQR